MTQSEINSKFVEFVNEVYAAENAAIDRINSRIEETPFPELRKRLEQHLQETTSQQNRLSQIIFKLGGEPTDAKAHLPVKTSHDYNVKENHRRYSQIINR